MTLIEDDSPKAQYHGPFTRGQLLPLTFSYTDKSHVKMLIDGAPAIFNVDYEIITEPSDEHPVAYPQSAYIKADMPDVTQITLYRETPLDQQAPFPQNGKFRSERIEQALDKLTMQQQEQEEKLSRCIIAPITMEEFNGQLPEPAADQALKWNADGSALENYDIIGEQERIRAVAEEANANSVEAVETANVASATATTALNNSNEAVNTATNAFIASTEAVNTANNADTVASEARVIANTARESAANAEEAATVKAEEATARANEAATSAAEALQIAEDVRDIIEEFIASGGGGGGTGGSGFPITFGLWSVSNPGVDGMVANEEQELSGDEYPEAWAYLTAVHSGLIPGDDTPVVTQDEYDAITVNDWDGRSAAHDKAVCWVIDPEAKTFKMPLILSRNRIVSGDDDPCVIKYGNNAGGYAVTAFGGYSEHLPFCSLHKITETRTLPRIPWRPSSHETDTYEKECFYIQPRTVGEDITDIETELVCYRQTYLDYDVNHEQDYRNDHYIRRNVTPFTFEWAYPQVHTNYSFEIKVMEKVGEVTQEDGSTALVVDNSKSFYLGFRVSDPEYWGLSFDKTTTGVSLQMSFNDSQAEFFRSERDADNQLRIPVTGEDGTTENIGILSYNMTGLAEPPHVVDYTTDLRLWIKLK